jgi:p-hydroxybenzoate 3-monooxygenase
LNLAVADVRILQTALTRWYESKQSDLLDAYSSRCLQRVWRAQHFSYWMTTLLHTFATDDAYARRLQLSHLHYVVTSRAAATTLAENYVGLEYA